MGQHFIEKDIEMTILFRKERDVLFVNAPSRIAVYGELAKLAAVEPPVWALMLAERCRCEGYKVGVLDAEASGFSIEQTAEEINSRNPYLVVFCVYGQQPSASTQCMPAANAVAGMVDGHIITAVLGTHPSALPICTAEESHFGYVIKGTGIYPILQLLQGVPQENISNLWWRDDGKTKEGKGTFEPELSTPLDQELPGQAWDLINLRWNVVGGRYRAHNWHLWTAQREIEAEIRDFHAYPTGRTRAIGGYASVQTSLGCPFACTFCCINAPFGSPSIRYWSPRFVAQQIKTLFDTGVTNIKIPDEMFCLSRPHVLSICSEIMKQIGPHDAEKLNIWAYARIDTVKDDEMLLSMRRAGFRWLGIGIESGSEHVRDGVEKKGWTHQKIHDAVRRVQGAGIAVAANYIFGLPDDTLESMNQTLYMAKELNTEWANFYCAMAYPGSALHRQATKEGWALPESPGGSGWIGYSQHAYESRPLDTAALTYQQVLDFRDEAFHDYFGRGYYQNMIHEKFGAHAVEDVLRVLSLGKPLRKHREEMITVKLTDLRGGKDE